MSVPSVSLCFKLLAFDFCDFGNHSQLPLTNKEWGRISVHLNANQYGQHYTSFICWEMQTTCLHPGWVCFRCIAQCSVIVTPLLNPWYSFNWAQHTGAKNWSQSPNKIVKVFLAEAQLNLCCSSASVLLPYLTLRQHFCVSSYFQGATLTWMKKFTLQWVLACGVMQFVCIQTEIPSHLSIQWCTWAYNYCTTTCSWFSEATNYITC